MLNNSPFPILQEEYGFELQDPNPNIQDTVTSTVIEVHGDVNGVVDLTKDNSRQPVNEEDVATGMIVEQQQTMRQTPLFDVDLEKMHSELFKGRYLTTQDFMDDIGKIVHNAKIRANEDMDRFYKAQAMFTAAQVSIQDFDPHFRLECERMASRERQRREERRKEKDKEKDQSAPVAIRRSARANGLQPEIPITDPVKLERRLKRQRGEGDSNGGDSHTSDGEAAPSLEIEGGRDAKRSRFIDERDDDCDPLDTLNQTPGSEVRSHIVRFATQPIEPMAPLVSIAEYNQQSANQLPPQSPRNLVDHVHTVVDEMAVDSSPQRPCGFDPSLLNPIHPTETPFFLQRSSDMRLNLPSMGVDPSDPFVCQPHHQHDCSANLPQASQPSAFLQALGTASTPTLPMQLSSIPPSVRSSRHTSPLPFPPATLKQPALIPMVVERSPTPLPDFHLSSTLVDELSYVFKELTADLTIEQLEQLRATSLGTVWRFRKEWDRDELVRKLLKESKDFINDISNNSLLE